MMVRLFSQILALLLCVCILLPSSPDQAAAAPEELKWERVNIPAQGEAGNWVLAPGSDVKHLITTKDGTLYAHANPTGSANTLFKSTDGGFSWAATSGTGVITGIAIAPDESNIIYYATASSVYKSADAGKTFNPLPANPGGAGSGNITITAISLGRASGKSLVAIGTADSDAGQFGGIYTYDESKIIPAWENTGLGNYDVASVTFSPNYASDRQLLAVVTDEASTFVSTKINTGGWNQMFGAAVIGGRVARAATITFPDGYDNSGGEFTLFLGIDTGIGNGDVFRVKGGMAGDNSTATDLNAGALSGLANIDITGLAASGNTSSVKLLAGTANSTRVYHSSDGGVNWKRGGKEPTGQTKTYLLATPDFADNDTAYAATSGAESALSYTRDGGATWNQISLIDSRISAGGILDIAISPNYDQDATLFMLTHDSVSLERSLWQSQNGGTKWERTYSSSLPNVDTLNKVALLPGYGKTSRAVFLAGTANGAPAIWKSSDDGQIFTYRSAPLAIDVWTTTGGDSLLLGSYNGTHSLIYSTDDGGFFFSSGAAAGSLPLKSLAVSPNFPLDQSIMVGNNGGWVYISTDNGSSFKPLPRDATAAPLTGWIYVAFDANYPSNKTVYAASNTANKGVYRFIIDKSTKWERIDGTLPAGGTVHQLAASKDGTLYALNTQSVNTTATKGGIERSVNPTYAVAPAFETITSGLDDGAILSGLWMAGKRLWSIDMTNTRLVSFSDSLARSILTSSPADKANNTGKSNIILKWEMLSGATEYEWQIDSDTDFTSVPAGFSGFTKTNSAKLPTLDSETTYFWRVRASKPTLSRWSQESSFNTGLGTAALAPELLSPKAGAEGVSLKPLFQWSAIAGATSYELLVADDISFTSPVISRTGDSALPETAWRSNIALKPDTTYYWKARASSLNTWSAAGAFITAAAPVAQPAPKEQTTAPQPQPAPPQAIPSAPPPTTSAPAATPPSQSALPDWFPYVIGGLLSAIVILLIVVLVLVANMRRS